MDSVPIALEEEIALEGLDGITLESLWFRLSVRLKLPLPFYESFKNKLWKIILKKDYYEFFEIELPRKTVGPLNRLELNSGNEEAIKQAQETYYIYTYSPVDDPKIRGSCREFKTRKYLNRDVLSQMTVTEVNNSFGQKLVIVASQKLRNNVLIPANIGRDVDINNHTYCILERIGRARYFGETTSGPFSLNDFVKDSKLLHYFRMNLLKNELVLKQQFSQRIITTKVTIAQIFHLPKYYVILQSTNILQTEKLFTFLMTKEGFAAPLEEVRKVLQLNQKPSLAFLRTHKEIFNYGQFNYREIFPSATAKEYELKAKKEGKEKKLYGVKLVDPNFDVLRLYDNKETNAEDEDDGFLDCSNQQINRPLLIQVLQKIEESKGEGMSQSDIGKYFGLSKLNARSVLRKTFKHDITFYVKDEGRQRISKYICKKYCDDKTKAIVEQVSKLLKQADESNSIQSIVETTLEEQQPAQSENEVNENSMSSISPTKVSIPLKQEPLSFSNVIEFLTPEVPPLPSSFNHAPNTKLIDENNSLVVMPEDDCSFVDNVENVKVTLRFLNNIPGIQKQAKGLQQAIAEKKVSQKVLVRMNMILESIKEKSVVDTVSLLQIVRQHEKDFTELCCRKSMLSLCSRLATDNLIKIIEMELTSATNVVKLIYFGEPNVTFDKRCWNSIIEEQKIQHFITSSHKPLIQKEESIVVMPTISSVSIQSKASIEYGEFDAQSTRYENFPKFMKYRLFHEFIYFLVYDYPVNFQRIRVKDAAEVWKRENQEYLDYDEITERIQTCYTTDINWKMFIPPLNKQLGYGNGWAFLRDIIHRIPLILFVKFTRFGHQIPEIHEYLMHPIKCNYLLHFLPPSMRSKLFQGRKYVLVISELCKRLCWIGLLQFGPSRTKEIDQTFIYLNRKAMLLDTRSSDVGYLEISEKEYPRLNFSFDSLEAVTTYWSLMFEICINTRINKKTTAIGQTIVIEQLNTKTGLINALKVQTATTAPKNDNGEIPGDRKGAAGLDKAFMSHLKQSWTRTIDRQKRSISSLSVDKKPRQRAKRERKGDSKKKRAVKSKSKATTSTTTTTTTAQKQKTVSMPSSFTGVSKKSKIIRKVKARKRSIKELRKKGELYDEVDKEALKLMKTLRVTWSEIEDKTLLLSKVAMKFAFPIEAQRSHYINSTLVRDILHWRTEKSLNKTSKACQRRITYLMKNNRHFKEKALIYLEELRTNREFVNKYSNFAARLKKLHNQEEIYLAVKIHLVEMIHRMHQLFLHQFLSIDSVEAANVKIILTLPANYDELIQNHKIINPNVLVIDSRYIEPNNFNDVRVSLLSSVIHSAVCSARDKVNSTFYLFETYQNFSDEIQSSAVNQLRQLAVISINKNRNRDKAVLPYTNSPFHLSNRYGGQLMSVHVPVELYDEYLNAIRSLSCTTENSYQMKSINCGWIFMLSELLNMGKVTMVGDKFLTNSDATARKKSNFDKISENYMIMKQSDEQQKNKEKSKRIFRLPVDNNSDDRFIYNDDPIEIFYKLDSKYLHIFCILQAIEHNERIEIDKWSIQGHDDEDEECILKNCILRSGCNFYIELKKIAGYKIVQYILDSDDAGPSKFDEHLINKFTLVKFFDRFIDKCLEENNATMQKDIGKVNLTEIHQKVSTIFLLNLIKRLSVESESEDGAWLSEYKKISHKSDDEIFDDEEDLDQTTSKSNNMQKDLMVTSIKTAETFVVNLSTLYLEVTGDVFNEKRAIDGETFDKRLTPFSDEDKSRVIEEIKSSHVWMLEHLEKKSLENEMMDIDRQLIENICEFLKSKSQMGATANEIVNKFGAECKEQLQEYFETLNKAKIILRTGVNELRFIHNDFATFWLVSTFYLTANETVNEPPAKKLKLEDDNQLKQTISDHDLIAMEIETFENPETIAAEKEVEMNEEQSEEKESEESKKNLIRNPYYIIPSPWIRVGALNRTLNRRCIDKWLGTILNYLSNNPGVLLSDLAEKFNMITPVQLRNLCEILESIGCIKLMAYTKLEISMFSEYENDEIKHATYFDSFNRTFVEVNNDAIQRLTFFIGKRKYKTPFV